MVDCNRIINSWFSSNTYILSHKQYDDVWLVDPGDVEQITEWMTINKKGNIKGILLTHTHFDHIYGINAIVKKFPECIVYVANRNGIDALYDSRKNNSKFTERGGFVIAETAKVSYFEEKMFLWPGVELTSFLTCGHSEDSICFFVENMLFTGDTLIKGVKTVTKLKGGSAEKLKVSIAKISLLIGKEMMVRSGHGESFCLDDLKNGRIFDEACHY